MQSDNLNASIDFYPRPPGGGRQRAFLTLARRLKFLSTPSGWRATPSFVSNVKSRVISIHALRVEGDFLGNDENV